MFSTSMIASSTTTPMATTSPARTITLMVVSRQVEHQDRRDQRQRDGDQADERRAPLEQEGGDDEDHEQHADQQRRREVVDRLLDEGGRPEDRGVDLDSGKPGPQLVHRVVDSLGDLHGVGPAELLDDQQQAVAFVDDALAPDRLVVLAHRAEVGQPQHTAASVHHGHLAQLLRPDDRLHVPDVHALAAGLDEPAGAGCEALGIRQHAGVDGVGAGLHHPLEGDAVCRQLGRVHLYVALLQALAVDVHRRHAGDAQQALPDLPVGDRRHLDQVQVVGGEPDLHDPARRRQRRHHPRRACPGRQRGRHLGDPLLHELARSHLVGPAFEDELDRGELGDRLRAQLVEPGQPVELLFDGNGDQLFDLGRGVAEGDRLDLDPRRRELGEDVDLRAGDLRDAEDHHRRGGEEHEPPEPQASGDDPAHQRCSRGGQWLGTSSSVPYTSVAPTVTISVPAGGPLERSTRSPSMRSTLTSARRYSSGRGLV